MSEVVLSAFLAALSGVAAPSPTRSPETFETALRAAETNLKTEEGQGYDRKLSAYFPEHYGPAMGDCVQATNTPDLAAFTLVFKLADDGRVQTVLVRPATNIGRCLRDKLKKGQFPKPPGSSYWFRMDMNLAP